MKEERRYWNKQAADLHVGMVRRAVEPTGFFMPTSHKSNDYNKTVVFLFAEKHKCVY